VAPLNDLKLFFKHKLFLFPGKRGNRGGLSGQLFIFAVFAIMIGTFLWEVYGSTAGVSIEGVSLGKVMAGFFLTISGFFFLISFSATSSYLFMRNEEIDMLLVLPVKRVSIIAYQIMISTVYQGLTLSVFIGIALPFHLRVDPSPWIGIPALVLVVIDTVLLASIVSVAFGKFMSRAAARKVMFVVQITAGFMFFIIVQLVPRSTDNIPLYLQKLASAWGVLSNPMNVFTWSVKASEQPIYLLVGLGAIPVLGYIFFRVASSIKFEPVSYTKGRTKTVSFNGRSRGVLLRRELKIYKRYEQLIYYLFYPVVFGLIFGLISDDAVASIFTTVLISTIFTTIQSAFLMGREFPFIETTKTLPISLGRMIALKATLPVLLGSVLFVGVLTTSILVKGESFGYFVVVPIVFVLYITSSLLGIRGVLVSPPDQMDNPNTFMRTKFVLLNQVICMGLSFGAIMPLTTILSGASESNSNIWLILISLASLAVAILISIFSYKKVKLVINEI
jgi:ABC-2 type transport system permease protein